MAGVRKLNEDFTIKVNSTKIRAIAFDYRHKEILFVDTDTPNTVWGASRVVGAHLVVQDKEAHFDWVVVDPVTNNLYFADNSKLGFWVD